MSYISKLSDIELIEIFKFLSPRKLLRISLVSKDFYDLSLETILMKASMLNYNKYTNNIESFRFIWKKLALRKLKGNLNFIFSPHDNILHFDVFKNNLYSHSESIIPVNVEFDQSLVRNKSLIDGSNFDWETNRTIYNYQLLLIDNDHLVNQFRFSFHNIEFNKDVYIESSTLNIKNCVFNDSLTIFNPNFINMPFNLVDEYKMMRSKIMISNCVFNNDFTIKNYNSIKIVNCKFYGSNPFTVDCYDNIKIINCEFSNKSGKYNIRFDDAKRDDIITRCCIFNNVTANNGIIIGPRSNLSFKNCDIDQLYIEDEMYFDPMDNFRYSCDGDDFFDIPELRIIDSKINELIKERRMGISCEYSGKRYVNNDFFDAFKVKIKSFEINKFINRKYNIN